MGNTVKMVHPKADRGKDRLLTRCLAGGDN